MNDPGNKEKPMQKKMNRRSFFGCSTAVLVSAGLTGRGRLFGNQEAETVAAPSRVREYRTLGRTGFKVSDISFGSGELRDAALLEAILDSGVNYIDCSESYGRGQVETIIGKALNNRDRKKIFITTKLPIGRGTPSKEDFLARARKCLERLQTESIDCLMIHCPATVEQMKTEAFHEAIQELRAEGRVRFCGLSQHGAQWQDVPETMERVLSAAAEDGRFDVMLFVYNFIQRDMGERVLQVCKEKNIGATLMKTNPVLNYMEVLENIERAKKEGGEVPERLQNLAVRLKAVADQAESFKKQHNLTNYSEVRDAAIRFVLSNPHVSTACITIKNFSEIDAYLMLSGTKLSAEDRKKLDAYASTFGQLYCRHACGLCEANCRHSIPVNTIMRYNHYFVSQGREKYAMMKYAELGGRKADVCSSCSGGCEQACPYALPVQGLLLMAHERLSLA